MPANYDTREPWKLETGEWFNYGAPGSPTEAINKKNPDANVGMPYVQQGDTGGFLDGTGITLREGSSKTPQQYAADIEAAKQSGLGEGEIQDWLARNPGDSGRIQEALRSGGGGSGSSGGGSSSVAQAWNSQPQQNTAANDFYQQLLARSQQSLNLNRNDPTIRGQADAYGAQQSRGRTEYLNDLAESRGPYANMLGEERLTAERAGQATGAFEAQLMGRELAARRDEIAQALQLMSGRLTTEQALALQRELGMIDAQLKSRGLDINLLLGSRGLDLQSRGLDLQGLGLAQNNDQFLRELALRQWDLGNQNDYRWAGLGG